MRAYIDPRFWADQSVEKLDPECKLALLWLITNSSTNLAGFCSASISRFSFETGLASDVMKRMTGSFSSGVIEMSDGWWVVHFIRYQFGTGSKLTSNTLVKVLFKFLDDCQNQQLVTEIFNEYPELEDYYSPSSGDGFEQTSPPHGDQKEFNALKITDLSKVDNVIELEQSSLKDPHGKGIVSPSMSKSLDHDGLRSKSKSRSRCKSSEEEINSLLKELVIPDVLNVDRFIQVFREWIEYRCSVKKVKNPPILFRKNLEFLVPFGLEGAIASLNQSMSGGWQGLFEPKNRVVGAAGERDPVTGLKKNGGSAR